MSIPDKKNDDPGKPPRKRKLRDIFNALKKEDLRGITKDTMKDLRKPKEIFTLVASSFIPGGWIGYAAWRVHRYRRNKKNPPPGNDR